MKKYSILILILFSLYPVTGLKSQERNKFIFGIGLGGGMSVVTYNGEDYSSPWTVTEYSKTYYKPCFSTSFRVGFAPSDRFFICWNSRPNWFAQPLIDEYDEESTQLAGMAGLSVSFYPFQTMPKIFINGLFGYSNLGDAFKGTGNHFGTGLGLGIGYELKRYFTTELNFGISTSEKYHYGGDFKSPVLVNLTINYLTF